MSTIDLVKYNICTNIVLNIISNNDNNYYHKPIYKFVNNNLVHIMKLVILNQFEEDKV